MKIIGVPNYQAYKVTEHAQERALTRFNIPKGELDTWMSRLLSNGVYDGTQDNGRTKWHWHSIIFVTDPKQKLVITVYSSNEDNLELKSGQVNPEVQTMINTAVDSYLNEKRIYIAKKINDQVQDMADNCSRMIKPRTNYRYSNKSWENLINDFTAIAKEIETGRIIMNEAKSFKNS